MYYFTLRALTFNYILVNYTDLIYSGQRKRNHARRNDRIYFGEGRQVMTTAYNTPSTARLLRDSLPLGRGLTYDDLGASETLGDSFTGGEVTFRKHTAILFFRQHHDDKHKRK